MAIHSGHRTRVRERFRKEGLDSFSDVQVLELLLFYSLPQQDTNPIAHALLDQFGSFYQVLDAPVEELMKVPGIGEKTAILLHMMTDVWRYYEVNRAQNIKILNSVERCGNYLQPYFRGRQYETVFLLGMDAKCKVLGCKEVGAGSVNFASISARRVVETALGMGASLVVLAHNHPSSLALPSSEDVQTTVQLQAALQSVEITLVDHLVVAEDDFVSLAQSDLYRRSLKEFYEGAPVRCR